MYGGTDVLRNHPSEYVLDLHAAAHKYFIKGFQALTLMCVKNDIYRKIYDRDNAGFVALFLRACHHPEEEMGDILEELKQVAIANVHDLINVPGFTEVLNLYPTLATDSLVSVLGEQSV